MAYVIVHGNHMEATMVGPAVPTPRDVSHSI